MIKRRCIESKNCGNGSSGGREDCGEYKSPEITTQATSLALWHRILQFEFFIVQLARKIHTFTINFASCRFAQIKHTLTV